MLTQGCIFLPQSQITSTPWNLTQLLGSTGNLTDLWVNENYSSFPVLMSSGPRGSGVGAKGGHREFKERAVQAHMHLAATSDYSNIRLNIQLLISTNYISGVKKIHVVTSYHWQYRYGTFLSTQKVYLDKANRSFNLKNVTFFF